MTRWVGSGGVCVGGAGMVMGVGGGGVMPGAFGGLARWCGVVRCGGVRRHGLGFRSVVFAPLDKVVQGLCSVQWLCWQTSAHPPTHGDAATAAFRLTPLGTCT